MSCQKEMSKRYIAEALIKLMEKKDFSLITNKDITNKAGLSHITYYRNFNSKDEIIKFYLDEITKEFIKEKKVNYDPKHFKEYLIVLFTHLKEKRNIGFILYKAGLIHYIKDEFDKIFLDKATNKKEEYNYYFISGGLYNIYYNWLVNGCYEEPKELAEMFLNFFTIKDQHLIVDLNDK